MLYGYDSTEAICGELMEENRKLKEELEALKSKAIIHHCKVGDVLYVADKEISNKVEELLVVQIDTSQYDESLDNFVLYVYSAVFTTGKLKGKGVKFTGSNFLRTVYLSKELAEQALKGGAE